MPYADGKWLRAVCPACGLTRYLKAAAKYPADGSVPCQRCARAARNEAPGGTDGGRPPPFVPPAHLWLTCPGCARTRRVRYSAEYARAGLSRSCRRCTWTGPGRDALRAKIRAAAAAGSGRGSAAGVPPAPTTAAPGTPEKAAVMAARYAAGFGLFHPADARYADDPGPAAWLAGQSPTASAGGTSQEYRSQTATTAS